MEFALHPAEGDLVLFPGDLPHMVEPNRLGRRITIAFNAAPVQEMQAYDALPRGL
eukprot:gene26605-5833_t